MQRSLLTAPVATELNIWLLDLTTEILLTEPSDARLNSTKTSPLNPILNALSGKTILLFTSAIFGHATLTLIFTGSSTTTAGAGCGTGNGTSLVVTNGG